MRLLIMRKSSALGHTSLPDMEYVIPTALNNGKCAVTLQLNRNEMLGIDTSPGICVTVLACRASTRPQRAAIAYALNADFGVCMAIMMIMTVPHDTSSCASRVAESSFHYQHRRHSASIALVLASAGPHGAERQRSPIL